MAFRIGIIGVGGMGSTHLSNIINNLSDIAKITALCDINPIKMENHKDKFADNDVKFFENSDDLIHSGLVDGVIVATPHYDHPTISIEALKAGLHVFCEKPAGVFTKNVREMNEIAEKVGKTFQVNFVMRATTPFSKIKQIIEDGEIGEIRRLTWIITNWYRTQVYYNSGGWRATWGGEGGGTLLNQNPHQIDLMQWFIGVPKRVRGFCYFGKRRDVEIETEANFYMEYENGATATYLTSVTEYPGTNRLEIVGNKGKLVYEDDKITLWHSNITEEEFDSTTDTTAGPIPMEVKEFIAKPNFNECQTVMIKNWVNAATKGEKLIAPGIEGINSLSISNAAYLSTWTDSWVDLPVDEDKFLEELNKRIENSTFVKKNVVERQIDATDTFSKG